MYNLYKHYRYSKGNLTSVAMPGNALIIVSWLSKLNITPSIIAVSLPVTYSDIFHQKSTKMCSKYLGGQHPYIVGKDKQVRKNLCKL